MHSTQNKDDEAVSLAGVSASSLPKRPPLGSVILSFQARNAAASMALEDASNPVEGFESIGLLAVRLVGRFERPKVKVLAQGRRGLNPAPASAHDPWEE